MTATVKLELTEREAVAVIRAIAGELQSVADFDLAQNVAERIQHLQGQL